MFASAHGREKVTRIRYTHRKVGDEYGKSFLMLKNHNHDLIKQLSETSSSLWRIDEYIKNSKGCGHCEKLWKTAKDSLEEISRLMTEEIGRHYREKRFE
jgi:hypothetical protein